MNRMLKVLAIGTMVIVLTACGKEAPSCDDSDTKDLVIQIAQDNTYNNLPYGMRYDRDSQKILSGGKALSLDELLKMDEENFIFVAMVRRLEGLKIKNIRTTAVDDELEQSTCKAQLVTAEVAIPGTGYKYNEKIIDITYKLSKTSEGTLFAEVFGL